MISEEIEKTTFARCAAASPSVWPNAKPGSAQDDSDGGERERQVQRLHDRREGARKRRPEDHQREDEPDVVGLPHRPQRERHPPLDPAAETAVARAHRQQLPDAGAEVGAAEDRVQRGSGKEDDRDDVRLAHRVARSSPASPTSAGSGGP